MELVPIGVIHSPFTEARGTPIQPAFAAGAERLDYTALRLQKLIAAADDKALVEKEHIKSMLAELEVSFEQFKKAEQKFWEELK